MKNEDMQMVLQTSIERVFKERVVIVTPEDVHSPKSHYEALFYNTYFKLMREIEGADFTNICSKVIDAGTTMKNYINKDGIYEDLKAYTGKEYTEEEVYDNISINYINQELLNVIMYKLLYKSQQNESK